MANRRITKDSKPLLATESVSIQVDTYTSTYRLISPNLLWMKRVIHRDDYDIQLDAFGRCWNVGVANAINPVWIKRRGELIAFRGPIAWFVPPFSILEWHVPPGVHHFDAFISYQPLPDGLPKEPIAFPLNSYRLPKSLEEVFELLRERRGEYPIGRQEKVSAMAIQSKKKIDQTFDQEVTLGEVAESLRYAPAAMTRNFKACYGMSPVQYRSALRIMDSTNYLLLRHESIPGAAHLVGFEDLSQYNKQFRKITKTVPSKFRSFRTRKIHQAIT